MPSRPTTLSAPLVRLILGTLVGMFAGLFAAVGVGTLVGYAGAPAMVTVMVGFATLMATTAVVALWFRDRGNIRYAGAPELAVMERPVDDGYEGIVAALARPAARGSAPVGSLFLLGILLWVLVSMTRSHASVLLPVATALVLVVHEGGHLLAMKLFGYRDARVFIVPFLGGLTVGEKDDAPAWQRCVVLLMGPIPGLLGCLALSCFVDVPKASEAHRVIAMAIFLNGFNLLPLHGLDGGQIVASLARGRPRVETVLQAVMALLLVLVGALGLLGLGATYATAHAAWRLRGRWPNEPGRLADASDAYRRELYVESGKPRAFGPKDNGGRLQWMQAAHQRVTSGGLSANGSLLLGTAYAVGVVLVALDFAVLAWRARGH
jgi:Zn-dependent protease